MSALEINKLIASILVAGLVFMVISVGVDEIWREESLESTVYPVPAVEAAVPAEEAAAEGPSVLALIAAADMAAGKKVAKKCTTCHDLAKGGRNKVGPNLWAIVGAKMASREGFSYSSALAGLGGEWGYDELDAYLTKPKAFAPGTKMVFAGLKKPTDRAAVIAFLRMLSDDPLPLPGE